MRESVSVGFRNESLKIALFPRGFVLASGTNVVVGTRVMVYIYVFRRSCDISCTEEEENEKG